MWRSWLGAAAIAGLVVTAGSTTARADPRPARMDRGFYFRFALGVAAVRDLVAIAAEAGAPTDDEDTGVVTGFGSSFELDLGWVVDNGIAIGLYLLEDDGQSGSADFDTDGVSVLETSSMFNVGAFLVYYPVPGGPWHMSGGIGIGSTDSIERDEGGGILDEFDLNSDTASGLGAFFSGGYEWRFSRSWALGASLRAQVIDGEDGDPSLVRHRSVGFALLGSVSYN